MKKVLIQHLTWLAPDAAKTGDWALVPSTVMGPAHWAPITQASSDYLGEIRPIIALQTTQPTDQQQKELVNLQQPRITAGKVEQAMREAGIETAEREQVHANLLAETS